MTDDQPRQVATSRDSDFTLTIDEALARKFNFAIQLLREAAELIEMPDKPAPVRRPRYSRRSTEREE